MSDGAYLFFSEAVFFPPWWLSLGTRPGWDSRLCESLLSGARLEGQHERPKVSAIMSGVFLVFVFTNSPTYSPSSSPELLTKVFEVTSLLTPSLMAMAFTVAVFVRVMASLYRALALVGALPSVV